MKFHFVLVLHLYLVASCFCSLQCVDESGSPVDWLVLYKLPKSESKIVTGTGLGYAYITSNSQDKGWQMSTFSVNSKNSIPGKILAPLYNKTLQKSLLYALYNDQISDENASPSYGHSKGVAVFDQNSGFWLIHSVPIFPPNPTGAYNYPKTGIKFGQTFLCLSLSTKISAEALGQHLQFHMPFIYQHNIPKWVVEKATAFPELLKVVKSEKVANKNESFKISNLKTIGGVHMTGFAKLPTFGKDLYADLVAPTLKSSLRVESWQNGNNKLNSNCNSKPNMHSIMNVNEINFGNSVPKFPSSKDHSKWAISTNSVDGGSVSNNSFVCIGDINRMESQKHRAGGTVCLKNKNVWKAFDRLVTATQACQKGK